MSPRTPSALPSSMNTCASAWTSPAARAFLRLFLGRPVVGFPVREPRNLIDQQHLARDLVSGNAGPAVLAQLLEAGLAAGPRLQQRAHALAPALVGHPDHQDVVHVRVRLQRALDLLGIDLLAARVDRNRSATEQRDA